MKAIYLFLSVLLLTSIVNPVQAIPAQKEVILKEIFTNKQHYEYTVNSNADTISWKLIDSEKELAQGSVESNKQKTQIPLDFVDQGEHSLQYTLIDDVYNSSNLYVQKLTFDTTQPKLSVIQTFLCGEFTCARIEIDEAADIWDGSKHLNKKRLENGQTEIRLSKDKWQENRTYKFNLKARDRAGNDSKIVEISITTPNFINGGGEVYGADEKNKWGRGNDYQKKQVSATLIINKSNFKDEYWFENTRIPEPLLTYTETDSNLRMNVYGHGLSKRSIFTVSVKVKIPSFIDASKKCSPRKLFRGTISIFDKSERTCLEKYLEVENLTRYLEKIKKRCRRPFNPLENYNCIRKSLKNKEIHYKKNSYYHPDHVKVEFKSREGRYIGRIWQEKDTKFKYGTNNAKPGDYIQARSSIFGSFRWGGKYYDYRALQSWDGNRGNGLTSTQSNVLKIQNPPSENRGSTTKKCNNKACKVLNIDYFNQAVNEAGKWEYWPGWQRLAGGQSCGAASSIMVNNFFKKLPTNKYPLKSFVYKDNKQILTGKKCGKPGAFAVTAYNSQCNQSSIRGIQQYLDQYGLKTKTHWPTRGQEQEFVSSVIKNAIDNDHPMIISYRKPIGHILVVKGYTYGDQLVVNDPYRDFQNNYIRGKYDYSGKDAIYSLYPNSNYQVNYVMEVYK